MWEEVAVQVGFRPRRKIDSPFPRCLEGSHEFRKFLPLTPWHQSLRSLDPGAPVWKGAQQKVGFGLNLRLLLRRRRFLKRLLNALVDNILDHADVLGAIGYRTLILGGPERLLLRRQSSQRMQQPVTTLAQSRHNELTFLSVHWFPPRFEFRRSGPAEIAARWYPPRPPLLPASPRRRPQPSNGDAARARRCTSARRRSRI